MRSLMVRLRRLDRREDLRLDRRARDLCERRTDLRAVRRPRLDLCDRRLERLLFLARNSLRLRARLAERDSLPDDRRLVRAVRRDLRCELRWAMLLTLFPGEDEDDQSSDAADDQEMLKRYRTGCRSDRSWFDR